MKPKPKQQKSRRGRGEGTVWQRPDGSWAAQVSQGYRNGKRKRQTITGATKEGVLNELSRNRVRQIEGALPEPSQITVETYLAHWMQTSCRRSVAGSTADSYDRNLRLHVTSQIGGIRLQKLTPLHVESLLSAMSHRSPRMQSYVLAILSRALDQAVRWGLTVRNVCDAVERPRKVKFEIHPLTADEAQAFLKAIRGNQLEPLFILAIGTGARQGELLALKWGDIDLRGKSLSIQRTLSFSDGKTEVKEPKTAKGRRRITLDDRSIAAARLLQKAQLKAGLAGQPWLFPGDCNGFLDRFAVGRHFRRILKAEKLPAIRFHDLRHTHATLLLLAGVHPKIVQERLGHATIAITLDTYSHVLPSMQEDAADKLNRLLA